MSDAGYDFTRTDSPPVWGNTWVEIDPQDAGHFQSWIVDHGPRWMPVQEYHRYHGQGKLLMVDDWGEQALVQQALPFIAVIASHDGGQRRAFVTSDTSLDPNAAIEAIVDALGDCEDVSAEDILAVLNGEHNG